MTLDHGAEPARASSRDGHPGGAAAARRSFRGLTVGFLDNKKHNFDRLVLEMGESHSRALAASSAWCIRRKANAATPAAHEIIEALAKECDLVFAGSAD